jgi:hypothetical protein
MDMGKTKKRLQIIAAHAKKNWFIVFAVVVYIFFTFYYMGPAFTKCTDHIYGFGDSTAGPIWRESLKPEQPLLGGPETATNYPYGESLYSPVGYASLVQTVTMNTAAKVVGPVCSYNLYNIFGYLTTSLVMFGFVLYAVRNRWIALLAGYAVAFTPYVQSKIGGHPNYGYAAVLISLLWTLLQLITYRRTKYAILFGILLAACAYIDPYFTLLAITMVIPVLFVWGIVSYKAVIAFVHSDKKRWSNLLLWLKPFLIACTVFLILLSPLAVVRITESNLINSSVGGVRGNVVAAATQCSNGPLDYLLPDPSNVHLVQLLGNEYTSKNIELRRWCGFGESRVSISLTLLTVIIIAGSVFVVRKVRQRPNKADRILRYDSQLVIWSLVTIAATAFLIGLPPYIHGFITPSGIILKVTEMWRIFAREYLIVNIVVVILSAIALKYIINITKHLESKHALRIAVIIVVFIGVIAEYQINDPFSPPTFSYSRDVPSVYRQVRDNRDIQAIAEYPIDRTGVEHDSIVYYLTMQAVHHKSLLNSAALVDTQAKMHLSLKDLSDPQTIPILRALGIHYVTVHGESRSDIMRKIPGAKVLGESEPTVYALTMVREDDNRHIFLLKLPEGSKATTMLVINKGYAINLNLIQSPINTEFESLQDTQLKVISIGRVASAQIGNQCFDVKMASPLDKASLKVLVNGTVRHEEMLTGNYSHITIPAKVGDIITLHNAKGYNMRINNLGCK